MKRLIGLTLLLGLWLSGAQAQLLYKISGNGLKKASYIVGTHHLTDESFASRIPGIQQAMLETSQVCGEVPMTDMFNADTLKMMTEAMMLPAGTTIESLFTPTQMKELSAFISKYTGADYATVKPMVERLSPAALSTQFTAAMYLKSHPGSFDPTKGIDNYFQKEAAKKGDAVIGLETCSFQIQILFKSQSVKRQAELLMCLVSHEKESLKNLEDMTTAYLNQDLSALKKVTDEKLGDGCDYTPEEEAALIDGRNAAWIKKMPSIMEKQPTLFAVGAAHLPGDKGVLKGLEKAGYKVEPMK